MSEAALEGPSAGAMLRQAREEAGLHVATLAATLKVPVRKLEALEEDQYELLGDAVFVRGLASSICRTLKIDPQPVLQRLPGTASPRLVQEGEGINTPFRVPGDTQSSGLLEQVSRPVVLTVLVLLLGALVIIFLPLAQRGYETVSQMGRPEPLMPPPDGAATVPSGAAPAAEAPQPVPTPAPSVAEAGAATAPATTASATPAAPAAAPTPVAAASTPTAAAASQPAASGAVAARGIIVFRTRGPSWIQVTDAAGTTVLQKLMEPGESAGASGTLPLSVTVGSVEATEVEVRGKPYNLAPVSRDNVARFQVK